MHTDSSSPSEHSGAPARQAGLERAHASRSQTIYADLLFYGCWISLFVMALTYAAYVSGLVAPHVPLENVTRYWSEPVEHYIREAGAPVGWGWLALLNRGDFLNFAGMVLLAGMSIICYLRILPVLLRNKQTIMAAIAVLEVLVLLLAASGLVSGGSH